MFKNIFINAVFYYEINTELSLFDYFYILMAQLFLKDTFCSIFYLAYIVKKYVCKLFYLQKVVKIELKNSLMSQPCK